jgi:hypothetical protein
VYDGGAFNEDCLEMVYGGGDIDTYSF